MGTSMLPASFRGGPPAAAAVAEEIPGVPNPSLSFKLAWGDDYPDPKDATEAAKLAYLNRLTEETQTDAMARYRQAVLNVLYYNGRQYVTWNSRRLEWEEQPLDTDEIRVTVNYLRPILRSRIQRLLSPKVAFSALPQSNAMDERDRAKIAVNLWHAHWRAHKMDDLAASAVELALTTGFACFKGYWNRNTGPLRVATVQVPKPHVPITQLTPEVAATAAPAMDEATGEPLRLEDGTPLMQAGFDEVPCDSEGNPVPPKPDGTPNLDLAHKYRPGDTGTAVRSIFNIRVNPDARGWTPEEGLRWLLDEEMVPVTVLRRRWPEYAAKIKPTSSPSNAATYERMAAGASTRRPAMVAGTPGAQSKTPGREEMTPNREMWQLPDNDYFPHGRLIVQCGECVVYDGAFPQGVFPYSAIFDEPGVLSPMGRPCVNDMLSPQDAYNREFTAVVQEMWSSGTGQFVSWQIPGIPEQMTRETNAIIQVPMRTALANKSINDVFKRLEPARVSSDRYQVIEYSQRALQDIGAFHEVTRGSIPPGLDSGVAIKQLLEQEAGQLMRSMRALENSFIGWARIDLALARWGYGEDEERWIPVHRPDLGFQIESVSGVQLPDPETLIIDLDNYRPTSEADYRSEIKEGMTAGWIDPRSGLEALDMGAGLNSMFTSQTRHYARARTENVKFEKGEFVTQVIDPVSGLPLVEGQASEGAVTQFLNADGSPFFLADHDDHLIHHLVHQEIILDDAKPWEVRQAVMAHDAMHMQMIQAQAAAQMAAEAESGGKPAGGKPGAQSTGE